MLISAPTAATTRVSPLPGSTRWWLLQHNARSPIAAAVAFPAGDQSYSGTPTHHDRQGTEGDAATQQVTVTVGSRISAATPTITHHYWGSGNALGSDLLLQYYGACAISGLAWGTFLMIIVIAEPSLYCALEVEDLTTLLPVYSTYACVVCLLRILHDIASVSTIARGQSLRKLLSVARVLLVAAAFIELGVELGCRTHSTTCTVLLDSTIVFASMMVALGCVAVMWRAFSTAMRLALIAIALAMCGKVFVELAGHHAWLGGGNTVLQQEAGLVVLFCAWSTGGILVSFVLLHLPQG